jgi:hypothetical protein
VQIPPPENTSSVPDKATKTGLNDYTGPIANSRVLHINLGFFKYGTNDKTHAAALVLSLLLFLTIVGVIGFGDGGEWTKEIFRWLSGAFLFVAGVAIGKSSESDSEKSE